MKSEEVKKQQSKTKAARRKIIELRPTKADITERKRAEQVLPAVGADSPETIRKTGIDILGDVTWGTHFCLFYHTKQDLIDILLPYFKAGLENNEFCMWVTSDSVNAQDAKKALKRAVRNLDAYIKKGQIEILDYSDWYTKSGVFEADRVLQSWVQKHDQAIKNGFDGLRLTGNTLWLEKKDWARFTDYEAVVNSVIGKYKMLAICTYSLDRCGAFEILDVEHNHQFALIKWRGDWKILESSNKNQLEAKLAEQTAISQALERSKKEWVNTFSAISDWVVLTDLKGKILRTNRTGEVFTGKPLAEMVGQSCCKLVHGSEKHIPDCPLKKMLKTRQRETIELQVPGKSCWLMISTDPVINEKDNLIGAVHITRDITERKQAEEALQRKTQHQQQLLETSHHLTESLDVKEVLTRIGSQAREILKARACAIYLLEDNDKTLTPVVAIEPPYEKQVLSTPLNVDTSFTGQAVKAGRALIFNDAGVNTSGKHIPGTPAEGDERIIVAPFIVADKVLGAMCLNRIGTLFSEEDLALAEAFATYAATALKNAQIHHNLQCQINERKKAEKALQASEEKYRTLYETIRDGIAGGPMDGRILECNQAFADMLGYTKQELKNLTYQQLTPKRWHQMEADIVEEQILKRGYSDEYEKEYIRKDGTVFPANAKVWLRKDEKGQPVGMWGIVRDVTERKKTQEQMRQARAVLEYTSRLITVGELASGLAHELNQPLCAIVNYADVCLRMTKAETLNSGKLTAVMERIASQANRAAEIIRRLRDLVSKHKPRQSTVNVNEIVREVVSLEQAEATQRGVTIQTRLTEALPLILADNIQLEQLLLNLVRNAFEAMSDTALDQRHLTIQTSMSGADAVEVAVRDTGRGLPTETAEKVFDSFFTTKPDGLGIGLALSRSIIESHGGNLWAEPNPDRGATFRFTLPLKGG